jgi:multidrug resistance protein, MATE family
VNHKKLRSLQGRRALLEWTRIRRVLSLSLPIAMALIAQNVMSLITMAMVGRLGDAALAGIGIANALYGILLAGLFGLDTGVQAVVARRRGAGDLVSAGTVLNDAILISTAGGLLLGAAAYIVGPPLLAAVADSAAVVEKANPYLLLLSPSLLFIGANYAFVAYWNGCGSPRIPLLVTLAQLFLNILVNYVLIFGKLGFPRLETAGAGVGSTGAAFAALLIHIFIATWGVPIPGFMRARPTASGMALLLRIGFPISIQQSALFAGTAVFVAIVAQLGIREIAAANVIIMLLLVSILCATGVGIGAATLVGQALGRGDAAAAELWGWDAARTAVLVIAPLSAIALATPESILALFIGDKATIALAVVPLRLLALSMYVDTFGRVLAFALRGAGATKAASSISFGVQWGLSLPLAWYIGVHLGYGLVGIFVSRLALYGVETAAMSCLWHSRIWRNECALPK